MVKDIDIEGGRFKFSKFGLEMYNENGDLLLGQIGNGEAKMLRNYAKKYGKNGNIIELGSYCGGSGSCMALGLSSANCEYKLYCIDWQSKGRMDAFNENMKRNRLLEFVVYIQGKIEKEHKRDYGKISMIFWDGSGKYLDIKKHFNLWYPKLKKGGVFMIHMYSPRYSEIIKFVDELKSTEKHLLTIESTAIFVRR